MSRVGPENKTVELEAERFYNEEKIRMRSTKASMTKTIKRLEGSFQEFSYLKGVDLADGGLLKIAMERKDNVVAVKVTYSKMKNLSVFLVNKLILVTRVSR